MSNIFYFPHAVTMKFAKQLETESESIPSEWRPYLIQYKKLKKLITKVADEIEKHGMSVSMLHDCLDNSSSVDQAGIDSPQVQYYFTGKRHIVAPPTLASFILTHTLCIR